MTVGHYHLSIADCPLNVSPTTTRLQDMSIKLRNIDTLN